MNSIAVFLNNTGNTACLTDEGIIKLCIKEENIWKEKEIIPFIMPFDIGIIGLRRYILDIVQKLKDCKVFVAKEVSGQLYNVLDAAGFNVFEVDGKPEEFLDYINDTVETKERNYANLESTPSHSYFPQKCEINGHYFLDLKKLLDSNPTITSKQALMPFFKNVCFQQLELICDHIPKWFDFELEKFGFKLTVKEVAGGNEYRIIISKAAANLRKELR